MDNGVHTYKDDEHYWRLSSKDGFEWVVTYDDHSRVINGEVINNSGKCGYTYLKSDSLVKKIHYGICFILCCLYCNRPVVGIATLNPVADVAAGVVTGVGGGAYISRYVGQHNYDPDYQAWKTYAIIIGLSVVSGIMGGVTGGYIGACVAASVTSQINLLYTEILSDTASVASNNQMPASAYLYTVL